MLASVFNKSRPINYVIISVGLVLFYFLYLFKDTEWANDYFSILLKTGLFLLLAGALLLVNFITKRNTLTKNNTYAMLLFLAFLVLFPTTLVNENIIISNFFILLALRRLISLQSLIAPKEKIFDASFWILAAALFHFWSILYMVLVFVSIVFHAARDYRNWVIPFIAFFGVAVIYTMAIFMTGRGFINEVNEGVSVSFDFTYFENIYQNIALAVYSSFVVLFGATQLVTVSSRPLNLQSSYKKIIFSFFIGVAIYVLSGDKNNSFLVFTFAPLAILGANYLESQENKWFRESVLGVFVAIAVFLFVSQL
jgi:hypothetical protein